MGIFRVTWSGSTSDPIEADNDREAWSSFCESIKKSPPPKTGVVEQQQADGSWKIVYKHDPKAREKAIRERLEAIPYEIERFGRQLTDSERAVVSGLDAESRRRQSEPPAAAAPTTTSATTTADPLFDDKDSSPPAGKPAKGAATPVAK